MPHTVSAQKRLRKTEKRRRQNRTAAKKLKLVRRTVEGEFKVVAKCDAVLNNGHPDAEKAVTRSARTTVLERVS
jgi:ribosomal protein S20